MSKNKDVTAAKPETKKARVLALLSAAPISVAAIAEQLSISRQAAYSLIGDLKRGGITITGALKDGAMHYSTAKPKRVREKAVAFGRGASVSVAGSGSEG